MSTQDATKARLLEAAGEEFAEKGFAGATVRSICARAGTNIAAVNYHFGDKEQLYIQAVLEAHRCGVDEHESFELDTLEPAEQLRLFIRHFFKHVVAVDRQDDWHHVLMMKEMFRPTVAVDTLVREVIRPKFERLQGILKALRPDLEGRELYAMAFSVIGQLLHYRIARPVADRLIGAEAMEELMDVNFLTDHISGVMLTALGVSDKAKEGVS